MIKFQSTLGGAILVCMQNVFHASLLTFRIQEVSGSNFYEGPLALFEILMLYCDRRKQLTYRHGRYSIGLGFETVLDTCCPGCGRGIW